MSQPILQRHGQGIVVRQIRFATGSTKQDAKSTMEKVVSSHSRTSDADDMALRVTQLGLTEMSIPEMINRWDERFKFAYAQGLGSNRRGEEYPLPKMHEAGLWGINGFNNSGQDGDRNRFLFEPSSGLSDD